MNTPSRHPGRAAFYVLALVSCSLLVAAMVTADDRNTRLIAQWAFVGIVIAMLVDVAIRGDDEKRL